MGNLAEDYMNEFQQGLKDFTMFFSQWWLLKNILNNSFADTKCENIGYWLFMQSFAQKQVNQCADKIPEQGKILIEAMEKIIEQQHCDKECV